MLSRILTSKTVAVLSSLLVLVVGIWLGGHPRYLPGPIADVLVGDEDLRAVSEGLDAIHDRYYREIGRAELTNVALKGAVADLEDRFSNYFSPREYERYNKALKNQFTGIGTGVREVNGGLRVLSVYPKSPAEKARIRPGDIITSANGHKLAGVKVDAAVAFIGGPEGTTVTLRLRRGSETLVKRVKRATVSVPVVDSRIANAGGKRVAYVYLSTFGPATAHVEMAAAIRKQKARGAKGIVFDLRGNGGGLVSEAQLIASMFLDGGTIVKTKGRAVDSQTLKAVGKPIAGTLPMVVLVDGGSASSSEIVAGALQDRQRAQIVGETTFGKGVFQEVAPLQNGGAIDITVGQYFLPSGRNLGGQGVKQGSGIKPDVEARDDPETRTDEALQRALRVLARKL